MKLPKIKNPFNRISGETALSVIISGPTTSLTIYFLSAGHGMLGFISGIVAIPAISGTALSLMNDFNKARKDATNENAITLEASEALKKHREFARNGGFEKPFCHKL